MYRSKTIFEDATPELVRDFFWDDELRPKWDPMLAHFKILEECPDTGMMIVHWIKKVCEREVLDSNIKACLTEQLNTCLLMPLCSSLSSVVTGNT